MRLELKKTSLSEKEFSALLIASLRGMGETPTKSQAEILTAHVWFETGSLQHCYHWNFGNLVAPKAWSGNTWKASNNPLTFKAYSSASEGLRDYLSLVKRVGLLQAAKSGDVSIFSARIASSNYTPGIDVDSTAKTLKKLAEGFASKGLFSELPEGSPIKESRQSKSGILPVLLVGSLGAFYLWKKKP